jgi:tetratricopeptide (TPR) repeat protein
MGTVYVAHDPVLGRMVAIKVFLSDLDFEDAAARFTREARAAAALNHANIVTVHDYGDVASQPYIVMEYVQGEAMAEIIRRKAPASVGDKLRWIEELCAGVAYAHQLGVVHRDIKPTNLMIDRSGRLKILDFGIAKMLGTLATNATALVGTPGYMAPEQILGKPIDPRVDLFSIGVVAYELLTYTEAFPGETVPAITHRIVNDRPAPIAHLVPDIHPTLVAIVERALEKNPDDRFQDAESLRSSIAQLRRQVESEPGWGSTIVAPRGSTPAEGIGRRGTGSARERANDVVGVAELTPPPDPRRTDREELARRRASQIEAALDLSRTLLEQNDVEAALDACEQALTLDETHAVALELEGTIKTALAKQRAVALLTEARTELERGALTAAQGFLQQARALDPDVPEARRLERDLRLARVEQERLRHRGEALARAISSATEALARGDIEPAVAFAREALTLDPESAEALAVESEAMRRLDEDAGAGPDERPIAPTPAPVVAQTMLAPPRRTPVPDLKPRPTVRPSPEAPPTDRLAPLRKLAASARTAVLATSKRQRQMIGGGTAALLLVIAGAVALVTGPAPVPPTGTLVIDAVPWAAITAIEADDGSRQPLPSPAATPLSVALPVGTYKVHLAGPPPGSEARIVTVQVGANAVASAPLERFQTLTPEEYFEQYLAAPATSDTSTGSQDPAAPPPDPATPPVAPQGARP